MKLNVFYPYMAERFSKENVIQNTSIDEVMYKVGDCYKATYKNLSLLIINIERNYVELVIVNDIRGVIISRSPSQIHSTAGAMCYLVQENKMNSKDKFKILLNSYRNARRAYKALLIQKNDRFQANRGSLSIAARKRAKEEAMCSYNLLFNLFNGKTPSEKITVERIFCAENPIKWG